MPLVAANLPNAYGGIPEIVSELSQGRGIRAGYILDYPVLHALEVLGIVDLELAPTLGQGRKLVR